MGMTDPIADMLTRIRNAGMAKHPKVDIPSCLIPEAEVFLGKIGVAKYQTPGTPANADEGGEVGKHHQAVLMQNHGVICWGKDVEDAYWKMENIDSYCRTVWIAAGLGGGAFDPYAFDLDAEQTTTLGTTRCEISGNNTLDRAP